MSAIFERQNDATAMTFLKASKYCNKQKLIITYYMIVVSLLVTLASIALRISSKYFTSIPQTYSQAVVLISGLVLISNIFCSFLEYEFNVMSVNLLERYDTYVFGLPVNQALMRAIPEQKILYYARKFNRKKVKYLKNYYFKSPAEAEEKAISFLNIKRSFEHSHRLLIHVYGIFAFLWVGYAVMIFLIAIFLSAKDTFIDTLINIFVPALSTISLIATSWRRYNEQSRRLSNAVKVSSDIEKSALEKDSAVSLQSQHILRGLQDVRFNLRNNDFTIPLFLEKIFEKRLKKEENFAAFEGLENELASKPQLKEVASVKNSHLAKPPAKELKESKTTKETKELKEIKDIKEAKPLKEVKDSKDIKEAKPLKEAKEPKDIKEAKDLGGTAETKSAGRKAGARSAAKATPSKLAQGKEATSKASGAKPNTSSKVSASKPQGGRETESKKKASDSAAVGNTNKATEQSKAVARESKAPSKNKTAKQKEQ